MKIILLLNRDIHAAIALNLLFETLKNHQIKIILSSKVGNNSKICDELLQLKKYEQTKVEEMFVNIDNQGLEASRKFLTFNQISNFFDQKITLHENINSVDAIADIKNFSPDLIISIRFGQILQSPVIASSKHGVINLHSGILPKYRGVMASFWAILKGENEIATTLHYIDDSKIDNGSIIKICKQKIQKNHSFIFNVASLYADGCRAIEDFIENIANGKSIKTLATEGSGNYFSFPTKNDIENFQKIMPLIDEDDVAKLYSYWS